MKLMEPLGPEPLDALEIMAATTYVPPAITNDSGTARADTRADWTFDSISGFRLAIVAFPLSVGIALVSGAPLMSGVIAGIVGAVIVARVGPSQPLVSGPAAGLVAVTLGAIAQLGSFRAFLVAVVLAGIIQIMLGVARADALRYYIPSGVMKGALGAIGLVVLLGQIPVALGHVTAPVISAQGADAAGVQIFAATAAAFDAPRAGAVIICLLSLAVLILWSTRNFSRMRVIPAPLIVI
ncbi:MAG: SulP family inorganic anion transporter, partial [Gemmatimonas sp.]